MPTTPNYSFPYPLATEPADVPTDMRELAEAVDLSLDSVDDRVDVLEPKVSTLETASASHETRLASIEPKVPANRVAPGSEGQVLTTVAGAAAWAAGAGGSGSELAYAERVSDVAVPVLAPAAAVTILSAPTLSYDGTPIRIEFFTPRVTVQTANGNFSISLWDGSTDLGLLALIVNVSASAYYMTPTMVARRFPPSAGSHTFHIKAYATVVPGTLHAGSGGSGNPLPAYLRITRA